MKLTLPVVAVGCLSVSVSLGCAQTVAIAPRLLDAKAAAKVAPRVAPAKANLVIVTLSSDEVAESRIRGELQIEGPAARIDRLEFEPSHDARLEAVEAHDATGEIATRLEVHASTVVVALSRRATGRLEVRYRVALGSTIDPLGPHAEPTELRGPGEDLLLLPGIEEPIDIELHLHTGGGQARAASSFGLGTEQHTVARMVDLRRGYFMAGDVGSAAFHATDGDDSAGWIGFTSFDPRWVSAEAAGIRSAVDQAMDRAPGSAALPFSLQFVAAKRSDPPILFVRKARGLVVSVDQGAPWSPPASIRVAQILTQRYVGGLLWVGDRQKEASGYFFSEGFSRAIAREVLFDIGILAHPDRAAELNGLLSTVALSPVGHAPLAELAREATPESIRVATARGALVATALDASMREASGGKKSLKTFLRGLVAKAIEENTDAIPMSDFMAKVHGAASEKSFASIESSLLRGSEIVLPSDLLGPCYRLTKKDIAPFELGFVVHGTGELTLESVTAGSRAEAAGLHAGEVVREIRYQDGQSDVAVTLVVMRAKPTPIRFLPRGRAVKGELFERVRSVPDERCGG